MSLFLYCPHLVIILEGTITLHCYALLNLNLREPWEITHFPRPHPPYGIPYHSQLGMVTSLSSHLRRRPIYLPAFLPSSSCNSFVHICIYICLFLEFYLYIYISIFIHIEQARANSIQTQDVHVHSKCFTIPESYEKINSKCWGRQGWWSGPPKKEPTSTKWSYALIAS